MKTLRVVAVTAAITAGLMLSACATPTGAVPESSPPPPAPAQETTEASELDAAWLDAGRGIGIVTYGSSTCLPAVDDVQAAGQTITVAIAEPEPGPCTMDYVAQATYVALPEGVDPHEDLTITLTGALSGTTMLDGGDELAGTPGESTDFAPSAGWFDETGFVVLTWGSSSCAPSLASVEATGEHALTLTFADLPEDQACTMDMAPRVAVAAVPEGFGHDDDVTLTLDGAGISGTTTILGDR